jgi:signal transduction histidine kinase/CheY-like chemotaxis protein
MGEPLARFAYPQTLVFPRINCKYAIQLTILVAVTYFLIARVSLFLLEDGVAVFWPAAGIASGVLIVTGHRGRIPVVLGVATATLAANLMGDRNIASSLLFAVANAGEAVLVAYLVERFFGFPFYLDRLTCVTGLFIATFVATMISGLLGTLGFILFYSPSASIFLTWLHWVASDSLGGITVAPLAIGLGSLMARVPSRQEVIEGLGLTGVILILCGLMVLLPNQSWTRELALASLCPLLVLVAARVPPAFMSVATFIWCITIVCTTTFGIGIFGDGSLSVDERIAAAQATLLATSFGALILASLFAERRLHEDELSKATRSAELATQAKSEFLAAASHDLRQPLQTMKLLQNGLDKRVNDSEGRELVRGLGRSIDSMAGILRSLLNLNRLETGETQAVKCHFHLKEILGPLTAEFQPLIKEKGLILRTVHSEVAVFSDKHLLAEMIRNLLANAVRYTDRGTILLGCRHCDGKVLIQVWDSGVGIAQDQIPRIFDKYYKAEPAEDRGGFGLGLAIVRRLGEILNHHVEVRSTPGRGTVFSLEVPRGDLPVEIATTRPRRAEQSERKTNPECVLLIEDESSVRSAIARVLKASGIDVLSASTSEDALDVIRQSESPPDVVVCDYNLRGSVNGIETVKSVRKALDRSVPAILVTGETRSSVMREITSTGASILIKPFHGQDLLKMLSQLHAGETTEEKPGQR